MCYGIGVGYTGNFHTCLHLGSCRAAHDMLRATFAARRRSPEGQRTTPVPAWFLNSVTPWLQSVSRWACTHPIYTILFVAIMASTSYIGLLETSLFEPPPTQGTAAGQVDFTGLLSGSKTLHASPENGWKWQNGDFEAQTAVTTVRMSLSSSLSGKEVLTNAV